MIQRSNLILAEKFQELIFFFLLSVQPSSQTQQIFSQLTTLQTRANIFAQRASFASSLVTGARSDQAASQASQLASEAAMNAATASQMASLLLEELSKTLN